MIVNYSVNDDFYFRIINEKSRKVNRLRWCYFETDKNIVPDLVLNLGQFQAENEDCTVLSHKYHVKENYFYCEDKGVEGAWKVEIKNMNESPVVSLDFRLSNPLKNLFINEYMAQDFLVPFLELELFQKGYLLLHGGSAQKNKHASIFLGRPGSFKTTVLMDLVRRHDYKCLGDDRVLIKDDRIYPFPSSPFLFNYVLNNEITEKRSKYTNFKLLFRMVMGIDPGTLPINKPLNYNHICLFSRSDISDVTIRPLKVDFAAKKIFINNLTEYISSVPQNPLNSFYKYILMYSLIYPNNSYNNYWINLESSINKFVSRSNLYEICIPVNYKPKHTDEIHQFLDTDN